MTRQRRLDGTLRQLRLAWRIATGRNGPADGLDQVTDSRLRELLRDRSPVICRLPGGRGQRGS